MAHHHVHPKPSTTRRGMFDASIPPILTVDSGDSVTLECVSGRFGLLPSPGSGLAIPPALQTILDADAPSLGPHIITGPVAVSGAEPGDMLEIRIDAIELGADWGYNLISALGGTIEEDFPATTVSILPIDRARRICKMPWGTELPLTPFFGVLGTAPPPAFGTISSKEPRIHGGNMDNKELVAGSRLFLPVWVAGALFSAGDGHGIQGDGEVCLTALEVCMTGTFTLILHKKHSRADPLLTMPRAESPTHYITMGFNEDLDQALKQALREMIAFICAHTEITREQAYMFCSLAVDFHVTQSVNGQKGVHGMLRKGLIF